MSRVTLASISCRRLWTRFCSRSFSVLGLIGKSWRMFSGAMIRRAGRLPHGILSGFKSGICGASSAGMDGQSAMPGQDGKPCRPGSLYRAKSGAPGVWEYLSDGRLYNRTLGCYLRPTPEVMRQLRD